MAKRNDADIIDSSGAGEKVKRGRPKADYTKLEKAIEKLVGETVTGIRSAGFFDESDPPMLIFGGGDKSICIPVRAVLVPTWGYKPLQ